MNYQGKITKLPGLDNVAVDALNNVINASGKSVGEVKANALSSIKEALSNMGEASPTITMRPGNEPSISNVNTFLNGTATDLKSTISSMTQLELNQLQRFNETEQRVASLDSDLDNLEAILENLQAQTKQTSNETVIVTETFKNMDIVDAEVSGSVLPSHNQLGGYITLKENNQTPLSVTDLSIMVDEINHPVIEYPNTIERPYGYAHEGRYYGFAGQSKAEGGTWNITLEDIGTQASDELAVAHTGVEFTDAGDVVESSIPTIIDIEPSHLRGKNMGPSGTSLADSRKIMFDDDPESLWEMEVLHVMDGSLKDLTDSEVETLEEDSQTDSQIGLVVSLTIDFGEIVRIGYLGILPKITSKYSNLKVLSIGTSSVDRSTFTPIEGVSSQRTDHDDSLDGNIIQNNFAWTFSPRSVRYVKIKLQETAIEVTPYPMLLIEFSRGISYESIDGLTSRVGI